MPKRSKTQTEMLITAAAGLFVNHTRDAAEIAALLNTTPRNVYRWAQHNRWEEVLQTFNYEGERNFRINPRRRKRK